LAARRFHATIQSCAVATPIDEPSPDMVSLDLFQQGDVYLDYPFEDMKFRYNKATSQVFVRSSGGPEVEIDHSDAFFKEAISSGTVISREEYFANDTWS
jgi:hypothetical protein